jgi:hypothetical protein
MGRSWTPRSFEEACKRAGGRRRYLAEMCDAQYRRRVEVLRYLEAHNWRYGSGVLLSKALNVSQATISRDIKHWWNFRSRLGQHEKAVIIMILKRKLY